MSEVLTLLLSPEKLEAWYADMATLNAAHTLAVTIALQSFIAAMVNPVQRATPAEIALKALLNKHAAQARERLLAENTEAIREALANQDRQALSRIHHAMSRHGFELAAKQAIEEMHEAHLHTAARWVLTWCREAKARGEAASGFPDALNFEQAGIDPIEYAAMKDTGIYLGAAI